MKQRLRARMAGHEKKNQENQVATLSGKPSVTTSEEKSIDRDDEMDEKIDAPMGAEEEPEAMPDEGTEDREEESLYNGGGQPSGGEDDSQHVENENDDGDENHADTVRVCHLAQSTPPFIVYSPSCLCFWSSSSSTEDPLAQRESGGPSTMGCHLTTRSSLCGNNTQDEGDGGESPYKQGGKSQDETVEEAEEEEVSSPAPPRPAGRSKAQQESNGRPDRKRKLETRPTRERHLVVRYTPEQESRPRKTSPLAPPDEVSCPESQSKISLST